MLPSKWTSASFGEVVKFSSGGTPSRENPAFWNGDIPWFSAKDLKAFQLLDSEEHITEDGARNGTRVVEPRTILVLVRGMTLLKSFPVGMTTRRSAFNQDLRAVIPDERLDREFLACWLLANESKVMALVDQAGHGTGRLGTDRLADLDISFPPELIEQQAIARILSAWDRGIRQLGDLIAAKIRLKHGLMQQLLTGKLRLKLDRKPAPDLQNVETILILGLSATAVEVERGLNAKSYDDGIPKLGECPPDWRTTRLDGLLSAIERPVKLSADESYQLVTARRYRAGIVPRGVLRGDQIKTSTQFETRAGDFLISRRQIVHGACGLVPKSLNGAIVSNEYSCLQVAGALHPGFLEYLTHTKYLQRTFYQSSVGVTVEKMIFRLENWLNYEIHLPPLNEQKRIVALLSAIDQEIVLLDHQQKTLVKQKKGLMQKLLTGQLRVKT